MAGSSWNVPDEVHLEENHRTVVGRSIQKTTVGDVYVLLNSSKTPCMLSQKHSVLTYDREEKHWTIEDLKAS